jgi:hypothetical protein
MAVKRIEMPPKNGRRIPNPWRYVCDSGHVHPSRARAIDCNARLRAERRAREADMRELGYSDADIREETERIERSKEGS